MSWTILLYESDNGQKPIERFINSLQSSAKAKLIRQLDLLQEFGPGLSMPNAKSIGGGLYELRVRGKQEVRVVYVYAHKNTIYLLHGFIKKTRAISERDLKVALLRQKLIQENNI